LAPNSRGVFAEDDLNRIVRGHRATPVIVGRGLRLTPGIG